MDIKKLDVKQKLAAGTALAVLTGFVPSFSNPAVAGTATIGVDVDIVTAITLGGTTPLDFGRLAKTGVVAGTHSLSAAGVTTSATNISAVIAGTPASFDITGGTAAGNVAVSLSAAVNYNGTNIDVDQLFLGGPGVTAANFPVPAGTANLTGLSFAGGGQTDVQVGGRITFNGDPGVGAYTGSSFTLTITDLP